VIFIAMFNININNNFNNLTIECVLSKKDNNLYIYEITTFNESSTWVLKDTLKGVKFITIIIFDKKFKNNSNFISI